MEAGVWEHLKAMQLSPSHGPTWASKWATCCRITGVAGTADELSFVVRLFAAFASLSWIY